MPDGQVVLPPDQMTHDISSVHQPGPAPGDPVYPGLMHTSYQGAGVLPPHSLRAATTLSGSVRLPSLSPQASLGRTSLASLLQGGHGGAGSGVMAAPPGTPSVASRRTRAFAELADYYEDVYAGLPTSPAPAPGAWFGSSAARPMLWSPSPRGSASPFDGASSAPRGQEGLLRTSAGLARTSHAAPPQPSPNAGSNTPALEAQRTLGDTPGTGGGSPRQQLLGVAVRASGGPMGLTVAATQRPAPPSQQSPAAEVATLGAGSTLTRV